MKIKELRKLHGLTQEELGKIVGASNVSISLYENDQQSPDVTMLKKLADALHTSVDELIDHNQAEADDEWVLRDKLRNDPNYRMLFSVAKSATPDALKAATAVLQSLKGNPDVD